MSFLTVDDVRSYIWDRTAQDNEIEMDLVFSSEEILRAMTSAAREYNSIPPFVAQVTDSQLPGDTNMFLDAVVMFLYISRMSRMQRNDIQYDGGGETVDLEKKQIEYMKQMIPFHQQRFKEAASARKTFTNLRSCFGRIG